MQIKGKLKIYKRKGVKMGREYTWYQTLVLLPNEASFVEKIREMNDKQVTVIIGNEGIEKQDILAEAGKILVRIFANLPRQVLENINISDSEYEILTKAFKIVEGEK